MDTQTEHDWSPPQYNVSQPPTPYSSLKLSPDEEFAENFARLAKWSPDGSVLLAQCENRTFQLYDTPSPTGNPMSDTPSSSRTFRQPSAILDFIWYPTASPRDPASFCFVASVRDCPVKLLDASDGRLRASYKIVDHRERQIAPHSLTFNLTAEKLYCGFEDAIEVFDVLRPGEGTRLSTTPSKKSKDGLKGIISALSFSPSYGSDFYAAGSLNPTSSNIAMFSESQGEAPTMFVGGGPSAGVTQLHFNHMKPHMLYASYRRHDAIYSWDLRSNVEEPLRVYSSQTESPAGEVTNQKRRFDIDMSGRWLGVGDQTGKISVFDLDLNIEAGDVDDVEYTVPVDNTERPTLTFGAHEDAIGSIAFHPIRSLCLSVSGSRHFSSSDEESDDGEDGENEGEEDDFTVQRDELLEPRVPGPIHKTKVVRRKKQRRPTTRDSSIKIWDFGESQGTDIQ